MRAFANLEVGSITLVVGAAAYVPPTVALQVSAFSCKESQAHASLFGSAKIRLDT